MMEGNAEINLQQPGAGLPFPELLMAKVLFWLYRRKHSTEDLSRKFEDETQLILKLMETFSPATGSTPILVRRLRGMEDSSRNWSAFMTLEHLSIVNGAIAKSIESLVQGEVPVGRISTADVKPSIDSDQQSLETFRNISKLFLKTVEQSDGLRTKVRYDHPWFGSLDAFSWLALSTFHMGLHRRQIELIAASLSD